MEPSIPRALNHEKLFQSFWQVGYEGADHINGRGRCLSMPRQTGHSRFGGEDYARARALGITTVRESLGWRESDLGNGTYDFRTADQLETHADRQGIQILWTLCHYGIPGDLHWFSDTLIDRFAEFCHAFAQFLTRAHPRAGPRIYTPINEISFLSWAVCETGLMSPKRQEYAGCGFSLKRRLVEASIAGSDAIWRADPTARMLSVDPLIQVASTHAGFDLHAAHATHLQFQSWDMLAGMLESPLGGSPRHLDLVGVNYYPSNQWEIPTLETLAWPTDQRRVDLVELLQTTWARYRRPLVVSETSHIGASKAPWLHHITDAAHRAINSGIPVAGICLYPALNRPDWEDTDDWHDSGLWHVNPRTLERSLDLPYAQALQGCRPLLSATFETLQDTDNMKTQCPTLVVFSHLRWDFVYQRPQHLLSRLAGRFPVLFVQEPVTGETELTEVTPCPGVTVLQMSHAEGGHGFSDSVMPSLSSMLVNYLDAKGTKDYVAWFYTPMALPLLDGLEPHAILYDCMDELSGFKNAPHQLMAREATLLSISNAVFTGGPSLYKAKRSRSQQVHCFPSSVDASHFLRAREVGIEDPMYAGVPHPRLGFYGVIDERMDTALIAELAKRHPDWQLCLVGPIVKIDPADLPQAANIHYFPQQAYDVLPASLAAWDVCLLPFALNDATRFISPTKTLEYLCAGKPVVSTAIEDVKLLYGEGVSVASDVDAFERACVEALAETPDVTRHRVAIQDTLVAKTSWDCTVDAMVVIVEGAVLAGPSLGATHYMATPKVVALDARKGHSALLEHADCLIVGAGPTGLAAAMHLGTRSTLVEANDTVGGWCRSVQDAGFTFDYAGHIMFSHEPYVLELYDTLLGVNLHWQDRQAWIYSKNVYTRYPFQSALYGLPPVVLTECLVGAIEARFGSLEADGTQSHTIRDCCADGTEVPHDGDVKDASCGLRTTSTAGEPANFRQFIDQVWGAGVAKHFAVPYNTKLWTVPLEDMETSWLGGRVPLPNLEEMIAGALSPVQAPVGPNARFGYPLRGGFAALMEGFLPHLKGRLLLGHRMVALDIEARRATFAGGREIHYERMISTIPLPQLIGLIGAGAPQHVQEAAKGLRHVSVKCVNIGVGRADLTNKHWIYYPEETLFHRVFLQGNASPHNNPIGGFGLTCEITYSPTKPLPATDGELITRCVRECVEVGLFSANDAILTTNVVDMPYAYVIYDHARAKNVSTIREWLTEHGITLAGRYSEWEYYNSDHAFLAGKRAAESISQRKARAETA